MSTKPGHMKYLMQNKNSSGNKKRDSSLSFLITVKTINKKTYIKNIFPSQQLYYS